MTTDTLPDRKRAYYLSTFDVYRLDQAVRPLVAAFDSYPYLVGSAVERPDYRDVDVRLILPDEEFDAIFDGRGGLWGVFCYAVTAWLRAETGLPIDFQVQRMTEANEKHPGVRHALGLRSTFAGGGDATRF